MITSIILVTYNKLAYTQACIESIRRHTMSGSYEIIVVDNGSTDDTPVWLEEQQDIICQLNGRNEGFPKACNQGIAVASGEQMMLLNNDTIVTPRWLEGLLQGLHSDPKVGAVGPVTNYASYMTQIPTDYETLEEMEQFAVRHNVHDPAKWEERLKLIGYCLLMKREACEAAGSLDERFGIGNYEDDDYSLRLLLAGYKLLLCGDTFIHHFGSVSFGADREKYETIISDNHVHFVQKWGFEPGPAMNVRLDLLTVVEQELPDYRHGESIAVLDIGCGCGGTLLRMKRNHPGSALYGLERDPLISRIAEAAGITIVGSEAARNWGIREGSLDAIIIGNAHEFASKPEELKALAGLLKPQGWLVGAYANRHCFRLVKQFMSSARNLDTSMLYTTEQVRGMLREAGLNTLKLAYAADALSAEDERFIQGLTEWMEQTSEEPFTAVYFIGLGLKPSAEGEAASDPGDHNGQLDIEINEILTETGNDPSALKKSGNGEAGGSEIEEGEERKIGEVGGSEIEEGGEREIGEAGAS
ncbi:glycosyltransferase, partial [Paenibacillus plantiphilus]|uniref:glycosyltransferase n=1 Tax=Paenibacillus plantiphilus TaxID=2905650 RepID=UPI001F2E3498